MSVAVPERTVVCCHVPPRFVGAGLRADRAVRAPISLDYLLFLNASMAVARINPKTAITPSKPGVLAAFCAVFTAAVEFVVRACVEADDARGTGRFGYDRR